MQRTNREGESDTRHSISRSSLLSDSSSSESLQEMSVSEIAELILEEQRMLVSESDRFPLAESYFKRFPQLVQNPELALDIIYNEYLLRAESTTDTDDGSMAEEYLQRFPDFSSGLHNQLQINQGLDAVLPESELAAVLEESQIQGFESELFGQRYRLGKKLGEGGFAVVFDAWDNVLKRNVAIKFARYEMSLDSVQYQRFAREAEAAAKLSHPGILQVFEFAKGIVRPYIVGQLADSGSLADRIKRQSVSSQQTSEWMLEICDAVDYAHRFGVVHRDLKPANILFNDESLCIADFGLASLGEGDDEGDTRITGHGDLLGTPAYMSPEQASSQADIGPATDIFSLGVVMYRLLCGKLPFTGTPSQILHQTIHNDPVAPRKIKRDIPLDLQTICLKAMAKRPAARYLSCREMSDDLRRVLNHEPIAARPLGTWGRMVRWCQRQPALATTLLICALLVSAVSITSFMRIANERDLFRNERDRANSQLFETLIGTAESEISGKSTGWYQRAHDALVEATRMESSGDSTERLRELMIKLLIDTEKRIEPTASTVIASGKPTAAIGVDPAQRFIVAADESGSFHVYSFDLKNQLGQLTLDSPETTNVTNIEVIEETKTVLAIVDNRIWMWDVSELLDSNSQRKKIPGHAVAENVTAISLDRPQKRFAVAIRNVGVMVGNVSDFGKLPFSFDGPAVLKIDTGDVTVNCMDFSSGSDRLFLGMGNTILQCRSVDDGRMIGFHKNLREPIRTLVSAVHGVVWSDSTSYSVCKWQVDSPNLRSNRFSGAVVSVINVGESSVAVCEDGAIHLMSRAGQILATSVEVKAAGELRCISTSNVGRTFFTGNADGSIQEWNIIGSKTASDWRSHHPLAITTSNTLVSGFSSKEFSSQAPSLTDFAIPISTASCFDSKSGNLYLAQRERLAWFNSASDETRYIDSDLSSEIVQVAVDPVQNLVATMHANGRLQVRNQTTGKLVSENSLPERLSLIHI